MPRTISPLLTPRVVCAAAAAASATNTTEHPTASSLLMPGSFRVVVVSERRLCRRHPSWGRQRGGRPRPRRRSLGVHRVDQLAVLLVHERPLELHRRGQLLVLRRQDLLDEPELLDGLDARELTVDP